MAGGPIQLWNEWATQILVLLSFALQIFLFLFARTRRRGPSAVLKILLWLAYLMADSTAVYTLGHLSISGSPREQKLAVFWAPFLLVHLGSQDTITAYALEDNKLWPRHLLNLGVQAFGVAYVLYKHIAEIPTLLGLSTMLMFIVGVIKYGERIWALKCATLDNILSSIREPQALPTYYSALPCRGPKAEVRDEEELLLFAQAMLPLCKDAMVDFPVALFRFTFPAGERLSNFYIRNWNWKATLKVVEMELSLMYDILYTKAAVIHNWYGYCIRVLSPLATVVAFVLFQISGNGSAYSRTDVAITYILLVGAFLLDMASVLSALGSTWTCHFLWTRGWSKLGNVILSLRRHVKAAAGNRGWSGSVGQFNLLHFCSRDTTKLSSRVAKMTGLEEWWNKWYYQERLVISEDVKGLVFQHVWQALKEIHDPGANDDTRSPPLKEGVEEPIAMMPTRTDSVSFCPESYGDSARRHMKFDHSLGFGADLQQAILTCHILTDVFFLCGGTPKDDAAVLSVKAVKALSDYMLFLIAIRPDTILGLELRSLYEATRDALEDTLRHRPVLLYETTTDALENTLCLRTALFEDRPVTPCLYPAPYEATPDALEDRPVTPRLHAGRSSATRETKLASVLQNTADHILIIENINLSHGTICARLLLELVDVSKPDKLGVISRYRGLYYVAMDKLKLLMPDLESSCRGGEFDMPKALALILDTWVRLLIFVSVRCSRDAHARQINRGGELTTVVWLMAEHAAMLRNPPAKDYLACLV